VIDGIDGCSIVGVGVVVMMVGGGGKSFFSSSRIFFCSIGA
jgi:hypothetical protein